MRLIILVMLMLTYESVEAQASELSNHTPKEICHSLDHLGLEARPYRMTYLEHTCSTDYSEIMTTGMHADNLALYAKGSEDTVEKAYIIANMYNENDNYQARDELSIYAGALYRKVFGHEIDPDILSAIMRGVDYEATEGGVLLSVQVEQWITGAGYDMRFTIETKK